MPGQDDQNNEDLRKSLEDLHDAIICLEIQHLCQREDMILLRLDLIERDLRDETNCGAVRLVLKAFKDSLKQELLTTQSELRTYQESMVDWVAENSPEVAPKIAPTEGLQNLEDVWDKEWDDLLNGVDPEDEEK